MKDFFAALFLIIAGVAAIIFAVNFSNEKIDGGYAGYVYSEPIFGSKEFKQVIKGPGSTGMVWRQNSIKICVTPYTQTEIFDDVRSSDQLKMKAEAYLVYRIDSEKVKEFVENYGAISETVRSPEAIAQDAYASFIQQPFRTEVRSAIAKFKGLDAPSRIPEITKMVETNLKKQLNGTPFIVESVTIGSTIPPESVTLGITKKVEATQEYERQATQLEIAKRSEEIANAEGRAIANKMAAEAQGKLLQAKAESDAARYRREQESLAMLAQKKNEAEALLAMKTAEAQGKKLEAEAIRELNAAMGSNYARIKFFESFKDIKLPSMLIIGGANQNDGLFKVLNIADFKPAGN